MSKPAIWAVCLLLTPICGAVLYYAWRKNHFDAATYANRVSWVSWVAWIVVGSMIKSG